MKYRGLEYELTEDHVKLARAMYVGWQEVESGAPEIDPKRPYGNSNVPRDVHEVLTGEQVGMIGSERDELTDEEEDRYSALHQDMEVALQVILSAGSFEPGTYVRDDEYTNKWRKLL